MSRLRYWLALAAAAAVACGSGSLGGSADSAGSAESADSANSASSAGAAPWVSIRGTRIEVELARSRAEQVQGLSDRRKLEWGHGMLFQYREPDFQRFWMKRMHFPIDIVWIRDDRLVQVSHRVPAAAPDTRDDQLPTYAASELVDCVLEVSAGLAQASGWRRGDAVELSPSARLP